MLNIAIDGPAGAGKSTAAKLLAERLGIYYLDTGAMYRAMALYALECGVDPKDAAGMARILDGADIRVEFTDTGRRVFLADRDVTELLRTEQLSMGASDVGVHPPVRIKLAELQRAVGRRYPIVMDGRDITTNVLPDTPYKFFITASPEIRAKRRVDELLRKGETAACYDTVLADVLRRDANDSGRAFMPLVQTPDAVLIDTTALSPDAVVDRMLDVIGEKERV